MLDRLSDEALRSTHFSWGKPVAPTENAAEDEEEVDDAELNLDKVEEEMAAEYSEEEEEEILHIDDLQVCVFIFTIRISYIVWRFRFM